MQIGIQNYYDVYNKKNKIFDKNAYNIGENLEYPFVSLREKCIENNIQLDTLDMHDINKYDKVIFLDMPDKNNEKFNELLNYNEIKLYLIIFESEIIRPDNWEKENHKFFDKVFTWNDDLVDGKKYIKYSWPNKIPKKIVFNIDDKEKLCTLIAGNKSNNDPRELYSERVNAINWFEENHLDDLDLYGMGWEQRTFNGKIINRLNRIQFMKKIFFKKHLSYKGKVDSKNEVLKKYKFAICYENAKDIPGYITEKIFDCFFAGCVPIYYGAPNICDFIPENTFISKENFKDYDELYKYIKFMPDKEYITYLDNIKNYLEGEEIKLFSAVNFANIITNQLKE